MEASACGDVRPSKPLLQIAPMMEVTHRDFRYFMRLLSRHAQLWTEMVVDDTLLHNLEPQKCDRFLGYNNVEHPIVCQLGGSDPKKLAEVAQVVERYGYDEVNLNVGCPSCRVASKGEFGCSLMKRSEHVRDIIHSMNRRVQIPVTVKCRLGVDDLDSQEFTRSFVQTVAQSGCKHFIIHARKAWLNGLSPAQNRSIPPLHYERVLELCRAFPDLNFSLNGGVDSIGQARALLGLPGDRLDGENEELVAAAWRVPAGSVSSTSLPANLQGVMIGRGAMNNPVMLWDVDRQIYGDTRTPAIQTRRQLLEAYRDYLEEQHPEGDGERSVGSMHNATKPTLGLFSGLRGNKAYRAEMDKQMRMKENRVLGPAHVLTAAMKAVEQANPSLLDERLFPTATYLPGIVTGGSTSSTSGNLDSARPPCKRKAEASCGETEQMLKEGQKRKQAPTVRTDEELRPQANPNMVGLSEESRQIAASRSADLALGDASGQPAAWPSSSSVESRSETSPDPVLALAAPPNGSIYSDGLTIPRVCTAAA